MLKFFRPCLAAAVICLIFNASSASAHAFPEKSEPPAGGVSNGSIGHVRIWFDAEIEPVFSTLRVIDAKGKQVNPSVGQVSPVSNRLLEAAVPQLAAGTYRVLWRVVARDGHTTEGDYQFTVGQ